MKILLLLAALGLLAQPALAAGGLSLGKPAYGGTGCPGGTARASLSADGKSLALRFDAYRVMAGGARSFDRKACGLTIPVRVPAGRSVAVLAIKFSGVNRLPAGASTTFSAEYFFAGGAGPVFKKSFGGPANGRFQLSSTGIARNWSDCGADINLRTNTSLLVRTAGGKVASTSLTAADVKTAIVYQLQWRAC